MLENKNNTEEDRVAIVEQQLAQAKLIAEEADKKYEEVHVSKDRLNKPLLATLQLLLFSPLEHYSNLGYDRITYSTNP